MKLIFKSVIFRVAADLFSRNEFAVRTIAICCWKPFFLIV